MTELISADAQTRINVPEVKSIEEILKALKEPFPPEEIEWRVGATNAKKNNGKATGGYMLAYIDARHVMNRLDNVVGAENWQAKMIPTAGGAICEIGIKLPSTYTYLYTDSEAKDRVTTNFEWIWKANSAGETDIEEVKGAASNAFKRAGVLWGIGRYLYDLDKTWVDFVNGYPPKNFQGKLPDWAIPSKRPSTKAEPVVQKFDGPTKEELLIVKNEIRSVLDIEQQGVLKGWMKENGITLKHGDTSSEDIQKLYEQISIIKEPIED